MTRWIDRAAGIGVLMSVCGQSPAHAQRAASSPSADTGLTAQEVPPPPPGFPGAANGIVFGGNLETQLQGNLTGRQGSHPNTSLFDDTDVQLFANYRNWLSVNSEIKLERNRFSNIDSYYATNDGFFSDEGLTMRQVYLTLRPLDSLAIYGGKIHPNFGSAYQAAPGMFYNFGSDYEQDERIGFGAEYRLPGWLSRLNTRVSFETFYLDTSFLSSSILANPRQDDPLGGRPGRYQRSQLGASNTGSLNNFTGAIRAGVPSQGLSGQLSFTQQSTSDPLGRTERGVSIGATYDPTGDGIPLTGRLGVTPFVEFAHFDNFGGDANLRRNYAIGGLTFHHGRWEASIAGGLRNNRGSQRGTDHQENMTIAYTMTERLAFAGGVNHVWVEGQGDSWTVGPSLTYQLGF
jgi:hypothetical protein